LFSTVVGAHFHVGGVGNSEGSKGNSVISTSGLNNGHSRVHDRNIMGVASVGGDTIEGDKRFGLTLDNMLNSMVLGNVLGSESTKRLSGVVVRAVVVGDLVGGRGNCIVGQWVENRAASGVSDRADNIAASGIGERADNLASSGVGDRADNMAASGIGDRADNRLDIGVCSDRNRVSSQGINSSVVNNSRVSFSFSLSLANRVENRVGIEAIVG